MLKAFLDCFGSLRRTVVLLGLSMLRVFVATLDQVNLGIWATQEKYFRSLFVLTFLPGTQIPVPVFPGGYLIGAFLLLNLGAAYLTRFRLTWKKSGIFLSHLGLVVLLVGELLTGLWQKDYQMNLNEGETRRYVEAFREMELAVIDSTAPDYDEVVAIPTDALLRGEAIQHPQLPFRVVTRAYFPNSVLTMRNASATTPNLATQGIGLQVAAAPAPISYNDNAPNQPATYIEIVTPEGSLGSWLISPQLAAPQSFTHGGKTWRLSLRSARHYADFDLTLLKVTHEVYPGSEIPKNFASRVRVKSLDGQEDHETVIYMNNPLRFRGLTFYQYQMNAANGNSVFQVVSNPSWLLPYVATLMMGAGLCLQFGLSLRSFVSRRRHTA